jgi:hypothetical protein
LVKSAGKSRVSIIEANCSIKANAIAVEKPLVRPQAAELARPGQGAQRKCRRRKFRIVSGADQHDLSEGLFLFRIRASGDCRAAEADAIRPHCNY